MIFGGILCLADLDLDEGQFHTDSTGVFHDGFDRTAVRTALTAAGFVEVRDLTATEIVKPAADGTTRSFSVFLMLAKK